MSKEEIRATLMAVSGQLPRKGQRNVAVLAKAGTVILNGRT